MIKAYSYIRMSTPEQLKGDSVRRQQKATNDYIKEMGFEPADIILDAGVSAFKGKNSEFGALSDFLHLAENGKIDAGSYLIVESLDRITRQNIFDAIALLNKIISLDINVVTLIDRRVYSKESLEKNQSDLLIASITMMRAHEESKTKSVRLGAAWAEKRMQARNGGVTKQIIPSWLKFSTDGQSIEVIKDRAELIKEIFELSRDGWGAYSIAKNLNERQIPNWGRAIVWQESFIKKLLSNRSILGEYQPYRLLTDNFQKKRITDGPPIIGYYPPVIDELLFVESKEAIVRRRSTGKGRKGKNLPNLFSGLLRCGLCQGGIRYIDKGQPPKGGQYLQCSQAVLSRKCSASAMRYSIVEERLLQIIRDVNFESIINGHEWENELNHLKTERLEHEKNIQKLNASINNIVIAIAEIPDSAELKVKLRSLTNDRLNLVNSITNMNSRITELSISGLSDRNEIISRLNDKNLDSNQMIKTRKKLSGELKKIIRKIAIKRRDYEPWEFDNDKSPKNIKDYGIEVHIGYKNGAWQFYDQIEGTNMFSGDQNKMKSFLIKSNINDME